jgi:hypothetical protein
MNWRVPLVLNMNVRLVLNWHFFLVQKSSFYLVRKWNVCLFLDRNACLVSKCCAYQVPNCSVCISELERLPNSGQGFPPLNGSNVNTSRSPPLLALSLARRARAVSLSVSWPLDCSRRAVCSSTAVGQSAVGIATGYRLDNRGGWSSSPGRYKKFHLSILSKSALGSIQPAIRLGPGADSHGVEVAGTWSWPFTSI